MKKAGTFMHDEIMNDLEREGAQLSSKDKAIYQQILDLSDSWDMASEHSQEHSWAAIRSRIDAPKGKAVNFRPWLKYAASLLIIGVAATLWFVMNPYGSVYTAEEYTEITLPDGSKVSLDVGTTVKYTELRSGRRNVELQGLAYFDVIKGKPFQVHTENGTVEVLGTSFNVNSFDDELKVECITGKVVVEANESMAVLTPGSMIKTTEGELGVIEAFNVQNGMAWMTGEFYYQNSLLSEVITEIERQFEIDVALDIKNANRTYSGLFNNKDEIEEVLKTITVPMGLKYKQIGNNRYQVTD